MAPEKFERFFMAKVDNLLGSQPPPTQTFDAWIKLVQHVLHFSIIGFHIESRTKTPNFKLWSEGSRLVLIKSWSQNPKSYLPPVFYLVPG
jgi:hypothetical protein